MPKLFVFLKLLAFPILVPLLALTAHAEKPSYVLVSAPFLVDQKTVIPGHTLEPGKYSIRIVDHLRDRYIIRVDDTQGRPLVTFIGLRNPEFVPVAAKSQGPIYWNEAPKGSTAVRGFSFSNGNTLEFVYPKGEAVTLAKLNTNSVPAIDPESEGRQPDPKLSPEDREVVTLWMLSATRVGIKAETPAIEAKRFVAPAEDIPPVEMASAAPAPQPKVKGNNVQIAQLDAPPPPPARIPSAVKKLPKTASNLPLAMLCSFMFLISAGGLRFLRHRV